jgi:hypothetical protein
MKMSKINFPSLMHRDDRCYTIHDNSYDLDHSYRTNTNHLADWAGRFDTYGDGITQHSPEYPALIEDFPDYCGSLASFIMAGGQNAEIAAKYLADCAWWNCTSTQFVRFAITVKYDENKRRYFSKDAQKTSTSDAKRHDRRWEEIPSWANGGIESVYKLALPDFGLAFLARYATADFVRDTYAEETGGWAGRIPELLGMDEHQKKLWHDEDWSQAFSSINQIRIAYRYMDASRRTLECWKNNAIDNKKQLESNA